MYVPCRSQNIGRTGGGLRQGPLQVGESPAEVGSRGKRRFTKSISLFQITGLSRGAESLDQAISDLSGRRDAQRRAPGGIGGEAMERDMEVHHLTGRLRALRRFGRLPRRPRRQPVTPDAGRDVLATIEADQDAVITWSSTPICAGCGGSHRPSIATPLSARRTRSTTNGRPRVRPQSCAARRERKAAALTRPRHASEQKWRTALRELST